MALDLPFGTMYAWPNLCDMCPHPHRQFNLHFQQFLAFFIHFYSLVKALTITRRHAHRDWICFLIRHSSELSSSPGDSGIQLLPLRIWLHSSLTHHPLSGYGESKLPILFELYRRLSSIWRPSRSPHENHLIRDTRTLFVYVSSESPPWIPEHFDKERVIRSPRSYHRWICILETHIFRKAAVS